jgi:hypothetical protein
MVRNAKVHLPGSFWILDFRLPIVGLNTMKSKERFLLHGFSLTLGGGALPMLR